MIFFPEISSSTIIWVKQIKYLLYYHKPSCICLLKNEKYTKHMENTTGYIYTSLFNKFLYLLLFRNLLFNRDQVVLRSNEHKDLSSGWKLLEKKKKTQRRIH